SSGDPVTVTGGSNNPNPAMRSNTTSTISRSDSIITVPLYDGHDLSSGTPATVIGFLQLGIQDVDVTPPISTPDHFDAYILNAVGCNPSGLGTPVAGGQIAPVPVRLIHK